MSVLFTSVASGKTRVRSPPHKEMLAAVNRGEPSEYDVSSVLATMQYSILHRCQVSLLSNGLSLLQ